MESLSDQKRGWQGRSGGVVQPTPNPRGTGRQKRPPRRIPNSGGAEIGGSVKKGPLRKPDNRSQFQRDWRKRCHTDDERRAYLRLIGPAKFSNLFRMEMEPDVLGQVISVICGELLSQPTESDFDTVQREVQPNTWGAGPSEDARNGANSEVTHKEAAKYRMDWLWALTRTARFEININFLDEKEKGALARAFEVIGGVFGKCSNEDSRALNSLEKAYAV